MTQFSSLKILLLAAVAATLSLTACEGQGEDDDLAQAQACLDAVPGNQPALASNCLSLVGTHQSTRASMLRCSIYMTSGGLIESKIVRAYHALKNGTGNNKETTFMAALSLDVPTLAEAYDKAVTGNAYCQRSGSPGLMYIGSAIVAGTYLNKAIAAVTGSPLDLNDPAAAQTQIQNMLNNCSGNLGKDPACSADLPTLGATTVALANAYCGSSSADQDVCTTVNSAVQSAGGDNTKVGQALFCYLDKKTYDFGTGACL